MHRRRLLTSAAAALPCAFAEPLLHALAAAAGPAPAPVQPHIVRSGEDRFGETHSRGFSRILFKTATADAAGSVFLIEHVGLAHGGPPVHLHHEQDEWFYVLHGSVLFEIDGQRHTLNAGDSILGPRKVPHAFRPISPDPARMIIAFTPAGRMEQFFRDTGVPNPPPEDAALFARYNMEWIAPPLTV